MRSSFPMLMINFILGLIGLISVNGKLTSTTLSLAVLMPAGTATADTTGTAAAATINAVLAATSSPLATITPLPTRTATPDWTATQATKDARRATAIILTLTAQPTATPNLTGTATKRNLQMATAIAATLTARAPILSAPTATPWPRPTTTPIRRDQAIIDADGKLNVRTRPDQHSTLLVQLNSGDQVTILGRLADASWVQIQTVTGVTGWVSAAYVKSTRAIYTYPVITLPPVATATLVPLVCPYPVAPEFVGAWRQADLGCATGPSQIIWAAYDPFERGFMVWRRDTDTLYVFFDNGSWQAIPDRWDGKTQPRSRGAPPPGLQAPVRGSGWVWGKNDAIFQELGWATDKQKGFCASVQTFAQGFILQSSTVEFCHEEKLYNFAREGNFGLDLLLAHQTGYWRR